MWLKKILVLLLLSTFTLGTLPAFAQPSPEPVGTNKPRVTLPKPPEKLPGEPDVGPAISPMKWGQKAPFTGVLLSPGAVATVIAELNAIDDLLKIELDRERKTQQAKCDFRVEQVKIVLEADKQVLKAQLEARKREINILNERLKKVEDNAPNMALWVGGSFVAGVLVTVLTTVAVSYAAGSR